MKKEIKIKILHITNIKRHVEELNGKMEVINEDNFIVKVEV